MPECKSMLKMTCKMVYNSLTKWALKLPGVCGAFNASCSLLTSGQPRCTATEIELSAR